jgi:hypothetical protein
VIALQKMNSYSLSQIGNANEMWVYFDMPSNCTVSDVRVEVCSNVNIA